MLQKFFENFNKIVNEIVAEFDMEYSAYLGEEFSVDIISNKVSYALVVPEQSTENFVADFVSRFPLAKNYNPFFLSLLHEIGHLETIDEMVDDIADRETIDDDFEYFNLFNERIATDWAGCWLQDNEKLAEKFNERIETCLFGLYSQLSA